MSSVLRDKDLHALGYSEVQHAGISWLANEEGLHFLLGVEDWSSQRLGVKEGWKSWEKPHHAVHLARIRRGKIYLIKTYPPIKNRNHLFWEEPNRAKKEFSKALFAGKKSIPTVQPVAVGERVGNKQWGIIIYPFLDEAVTLERIYSHDHFKEFGIKERHNLEKSVGRLIRKFIEVGAYPLDAHLDHFLATKVEEKKISVYYIDLERVKFNSLSKRLMQRRKLIKTMGRLIARLEWFRMSGGRINRASMVRIGRASFRDECVGTLDKKLCRLVIHAARKFWYRRKFHTRGPYPLRSIELNE